MLILAALDAGETQVRGRQININLSRRAARVTQRWPERTVVDIGRLPDVLRMLNYFGETWVPGRRRVTATNPKVKRAAFTTRLSSFRCDALMALRTRIRIPPSEVREPPVTDLRDHQDDSSVASMAISSHSTPSRDPRRHELYWI